MEKSIALQQAQVSGKQWSTQVTNVDCISFILSDRSEEVSVHLTHVVIGIQLCTQVESSSEIRYAGPTLGLMNLSLLLLNAWPKNDQLVKLLNSLTGRSSIHAYTLYSVCNSIANKGGMPYASGHCLLRSLVPNSAYRDGVNMLSVLSDSVLSVLCVCTLACCYHACLRVSMSSLICICSACIPEVIIGVHLGTAITVNLWIHFDRGLSGCLCMLMHS